MEGGVFAVARELVFARFAVVRVLVGDDDEAVAPAVLVAAYGVDGEGRSEGSSWLAGGDWGGGGSWLAGGHSSRHGRCWL